VRHNFAKVPTYLTFNRLVASLMFVFAFATTVRSNHMALNEIGSLTSLELGTLRLMSKLICAESKANRANVSSLCRPSGQSRCHKVKQSGSSFVLS
jgi:hypothetical protein